MNSRSIKTKNVSAPQMDVKENTFKTKKDKKEKSVKSVKSQRVLVDFKSTATRSLCNVRNTLGNISQVICILYVSV